MSSILELTALGIRDGVLSGNLSATQVAEAYLERSQELDPRVRAFLHLDPEAVLARARRVDDKKATGQSLGPLAGIPVALKDNICTRGEKTTAGSRMLEDFVPPYDAFVVERILACDGVPFGKTNLDEFAMGSSCENSAYFPTRNPWDLDRVPGGSSGGSAAAVAAGMAPLALGSDTGGSIRQPASLCGITGMKPTYGRVSRRGLIAFASSLDQIGPLARDARDAALLLSAIAGKDPRDGTCVDREVTDYVGATGEDVSGLRLGLPAEYMDDTLPDSVRRPVEEALKVLTSLGATIEEVHLPHTWAVIPTYYLVANSEASSNLARYDGMRYGHRTSHPSESLGEVIARSRTEGFGAEVKRRILIGTHALSSGYYDAYYLKGLRVRALIQGDFARALEKVDAVVGPTSPVTAFPLGEKVNDPLAMYLLDVLTAGVNLAGLPAVSIPTAPDPQGLPVGLQLVGRPFAEETLLRIAAAFQRTTDHHLRRPDLS